MDALIVALHFAVAHKVFVMMLLMGLALPAIVMSKRRKALGPWAVASLLVATIAFGNMFFGHRLLGVLLDRYGERGTGTIVTAHETSSRMNGRAVKRYDVLIRTANGSAVETGFDGFAMPLYPAPEDAYLFPQPGVEFQASYLASRPQVFVIRTDGQSVYAQGLRCVELAHALAGAKARSSFAPESAEYRTAHAQAIEAFAAAGCIANSKPAARARLRQQAADAS